MVQNSAITIIDTHIKDNCEIFLFFIVYLLLLHTFNKVLIITTIHEYNI